jgi:hypothetical protein
MMEPLDRSPAAEAIRRANARRRAAATPPPPLDPDDIPIAGPTAATGNLLLTDQDGNCLATVKLIQGRIKESNAVALLLSRVKHRTTALKRALACLAHLQAELSTADEGAFVAELKMIRDHVELIQRELSITDESDTNRTDEAAGVATAHPAADDGRAADAALAGDAGGAA